MTTQTLVYRSTYVINSIAKDLVANGRKWVKEMLPRPCMLISGGLLFVGLGIPFLMSFALIPGSLFLGFLGLIFTCSGIVLTFYYL